MSMSTLKVSAFTQLVRSGVDEVATHVIVCIQELEALRFVHRAHHVVPLIPDAEGSQANGRDMHGCPLGEAAIDLEL